MNQPICLKFVTSKKNLMNKIFTLAGIFTLLSCAASAQTTHAVNVSDFQFSPSSLTIEVGDIVQWTKTSGFHNVNGSNESFPSNPVAFGNEPSGDNWVYEFTFTVEGEYNYNCEIHPGMQGSISVSNTSSVGDNGDENISIYPNPVVDEFKVVGLTPTSKPSIIMVYDITGKLALSSRVVNTQSISVDELQSGIYIYKLMVGNEQVKAGKLIIR